MFLNNYQLNYVCADTYLQHSVQGPAAQGASRNFSSGKWKLDEIVCMKIQVIDLDYQVIASPPLFRSWSTRNTLLLTVMSLSVLVYFLYLSTCTTLNILME
jgi:hypothetical protein